MAVKVSDTFTDTDGTLLSAHTPEQGSSWTFYNGAGGDATEIRSNRLNHTVSGASYYSSAATLTNDQIATVHLVRLSNVTNQQLGVVLRNTPDTTQDGYLFRTARASITNQHSIYEIVDGVATQIANINLNMTGTDYTFTFESIGTTHRYLLDAGILTAATTQRLSVVNANIASGGAAIYHALAVTDATGLHYTDIEYSDDSAGTTVLETAGTASGTSSTSVLTKEIREATGLATGISTTNVATKQFYGATGVAAGISTETVVTKILLSTIGSASGAATISVLSKIFAEAAGLSNGTATINAVTKIVAQTIGAANGTSLTSILSVVIETLESIAAANGTSSTSAAADVLIGTSGIASGQATESVLTRFSVIASGTATGLSTENSLSVLDVVGAAIAAGNVSTNADSLLTVVGSGSVAGTSISSILTQFILETIPEISSGVSTESVSTRLFANETGQSGGTSQADALTKQIVTNSVEASGSAISTINTRLFVLANAESIGTSDVTVLTIISEILTSLANAVGASTTMAVSHTRETVGGTSTGESFTNLVNLFIFSTLAEAIGTSETSAQSSLDNVLTTSAFAQGISTVQIETRVMQLASGASSGVASVVVVNGVLFGVIATSAGTSTESAHTLAQRFEDTAGSALGESSVAASSQLLFVTTGNAQGISAETLSNILLMLASGQAHGTVIVSLVIQVHVDEYTIRASFIARDFQRDFDANSEETNKYNANDSDIDFDGPDNQQTYNAASSISSYSGRKV